MTPPSLSSTSCDQYCRWCGNLCGVYIKNFSTDQLEKEFWKLVNICQSYYQTSRSKLFWDTVCAIKTYSAYSLRRAASLPRYNIDSTKLNTTRRALGRAHVPPTKVFPRLAVNKTILKPRLTAATGAQYLYVEFSRRNKIPRCSTYDIGESNPVPASGL